MGNTILLFVIILAFITTIISIKESDFRRTAAILAFFCLLACGLHYYYCVQFNKTFIDTVNSSNINNKLELYNNNRLNENQKNQLIYSIANNIESTSITALNTVLVKNKNKQIIKLFFQKLHERGFFFNDEQLEFLVVNAIKDKNIAYKEMLFPSSLSNEKVLNRAINQIDSFKQDNSHIELQETMEGFPELFNEKEIQLAKNIAETYQKTLEISNGTSKNNKDFDILISKKNELEKQVMAFPLNWTLIGKVEEFSEEFNGIIISNASLEGKSLEGCILRTDKQMTKGDSIQVSVKDEGKSVIELPNGKYVTYRMFSEDYSSEKRNELNKQIVKINDKLKESENLVGTDKNTLEANKLFVKINLESLKKSIAMKVKKYEL